MDLRKTTTAIGTLMMIAAAPIAISAHESADHDTEFGPEQGDIEFTLGANGSNDKKFDTGQFSLATSLGVFLTEGIELGARHNMSFFDTDDSSAVFVATTRGFADYHFDFDRVQPFIGANLGIRYGNHNVDEVGTIAPEWGIKLFALENAFVMGLMEYQWFFDEADDLDDNADDGQFVYTISLGMNF
jgi:hypothetical protein